MKSNVAILIIPLQDLTEIKRTFKYMRIDLDARMIKPGKVSGFVLPNKIGPCISSGFCGGSFMCYLKQISKLIKPLPSANVNYI